MVGGDAKGKDVCFAFRGYTTDKEKRIPGNLKPRPFWELLS